MPIDADISMTPRDLDCLRAIDQLVRAHPYRPTLREIADVLGVSSPNAIHVRVGRLVQLGLVSRRPRMHRAINVTEGGRAALSVEVDRVRTFGTRETSNA